MTREKWAKLTPEEQRIKVAELCGWVYDGRRTVATGRPEEQVWCIPTTEKWARTFELPDYLNDLNAMHKAEKLLKTEAQLDSWYGCLKHLVRVDGNHTSSTQAMQATAAQRAEAFVLTMETA